MLKLELGAVKVAILTPFLLVCIPTVVATGTDLSEITLSGARIAWGAGKEGLGIGRLPGD